MTNKTRFDSPASEIAHPSSLSRSRGLRAAPVMAKSTEPIDLDELGEVLATVFDQVQQSLANHKKNCVALFKLHQRAATDKKTTQKKNGTSTTKYTGEKAFADAFLDMVNRVLVVKKGPPAADRIVRFVGAYVEYLNEKAIQEQANSDSDEAEDTTTSRFVARILGWLLQGFSAKNKVVRFRCLHVVSELISHIGEVDEDTYSLLREGLVERLNDKETLIRANAAAALSKLVGSEDPDEVEAGEQSVLDILLEVLSTDPTAEVRRAALLNVPLTSATIDSVLLRTRDVDTITRKIMYTAVLPRLGHPRQLTLVQREQVIKDGLGDREPGVRVAAGKLLAKWFDTVQGDDANSEDDPEAWVGDDGGMMKAFVRFLGLFDVVGSGEAIAVDAATCIFVTRPDIPDAFIFPELYWKQLTPESSVLARVFVEHCVKTSNETRLESASLPVVTAFAFHTQEAYNLLLKVLEQMESARMVQPEGEADTEELEEELAKREVVLGELLRMALKLDYMDEIGRRKVFTVVKDMLGHPQLPPSLIERCVDVLKEIMPSERDLIRVVVEIIVELRENEELEETENLLENLDSPDPDQTENISAVSRSANKTRDRNTMSAEDRRQADIADIRCLMLCTAVLERVNGSFEDNSTLEGILADLIIPSVKRKELAMREKALVSLGLCCLIAKNMALRSFQLFLGQVENAPPELKLQVLRVILDLLIMYDHEFFRNSEGIAQQVTNFLIQTLQSEEIPQAQAVLCTGICKLLLAGIITDTTVIESLVLLYISPTTIENQELRQCLSYFFPVYAYASYENQTRVQSMFLSAYDNAKRIHGELEDDQEMISPPDFGMMFVDWTDPTKAVNIGKAELSVNENAHADFAIQLLTALYDEERTDDDRKAFCQMLSQLQIWSKVGRKSIHKLDLLISNQERQCPFDNASIEKIFAKFRTRFFQTFHDQLKDIDAREYAEDKDVLEVYTETAVNPPHVDDAFRAAQAAESTQAPPPDQVDTQQQNASAPTSVAPVPSEMDSEKTLQPEEKDETEATLPSHEPSDNEEMSEPVERPSTPLSKGVKRLHDTPGTSREDRKRTRKSKGDSDEEEEEAEEVPEPERSPTPTKAKPKARAKAAAKPKAPAKAKAAAPAKKAKATKTAAPAPTRASGRGRKKVVKEPTPEASDEEENGLSVVEDSEEEI